MDTSTDKEVDEFINMRIQEGVEDAELLKEVSARFGMSDLGPEMRDGSNIKSLEDLNRFE